MSKKVEEKLYQNRYLVDEGKPHVHVKDPTKVTENLKSLVSCCPAGCWGMQEDGTIVSTLDGCLECGTCRILCAETDDLEWSYPRGGFGVLYKFG
jgi:ferredoxin like protein